jgi:hypothetical protein
MKIVSAILVAAALAACTSGPPALNPEIAASDHQQRVYDTWTVETIQQASMTAALVEQRAVFPYYFVPESATLTDLAKRDLSVLADHYKESPGTLVLVRGDASDVLFARRREALLAALQQAGVTADRVSVVEGFPGGEGLTGQSIFEARENARRSGGGASTDTGSVTISGSTTAQP